MKLKRYFYSLELEKITEEYIKSSNSKEIFNKLKQKFEEAVS
jgi:hypothetical protein